MTAGKRLVAGGAVVTMLATAVGSASTGKEGGTFRIVEPGLLSTIDPALVSFPPEFVILRPACAALVAFPEKPLPAGLEVEPELAEALPTVSRNGKTYTFTVRKDARFSNGKPVTARDFKHALERILDPVMKSPNTTPLESIVGARAMLDGTTKKLAGAVARGRMLTLKLTKPAPDFILQLAGATCAVPETLPVDPEGAKAPLPSAAPYYVAQYVPGDRLVLERNRHYRGSRPRHVDRFVVELGADIATAFTRVEEGSADYALGPPSYFAENAARLARQYGVNKTQLFVHPSLGIRMYALNTSRPLFKANVKLRQAVNFAVDRRALVRELGSYAGSATDQFMPPSMPGHVKARIYPLTRSELRKARALAAGNQRSGKAVLYTLDFPLDIAQAEIVRQNLAKIGIEVEVQKFPIQLLFQKLSTPGEPFDIGRISWSGFVDGSFLNFMFDGRTIGQPNFGNWSYFDSSTVNRALDRASKLPLGPERQRAYGQLDVQLARDAAPAIPYGLQNEFTLVSKRVGCVVVNPLLVLAAACLK